MLRSFKSFLAGVCFLLSCVPACDSGFKKAAEATSEPEPEPEPSAEPEVVPEDAGPTRTPFVVPDSEFELDDAELTVEELDESDLEDLCQAHERRLDAITEHFSEESSLCLLAAVSEAERIATSNATFTARCESVLDECEAEGPSNPLDEYVPPAARSLQCDDWSASDCDISAQALVTCLEDVVENLNDRLNDVASCDLSRGTAQTVVSRIEGLEAAADPFVLSNRCADAACLLGSGSVVDAGN
jgi:hypothetical protein